MTPDRLRDHGHVTVQYGDQSGWGHALAEGGEPFHVAKQDRHLAARAFGIGQLRPVDQPGDNVPIDVFAKSLADLRF